MATSQPSPPVPSGRAARRCGCSTRRSRSTARCGCSTAQADPDVPWAYSLELMKRLRSADVQAVFVKDGDHRLSRDERHRAADRDGERTSGEPVILVLMLLALRPSTIRPSPIRRPPLLSQTRRPSGTAPTSRRASRRTPSQVANDWLVKGGGIYARQCLGLAYAQLGSGRRPPWHSSRRPSEAETKQDNRRADFWVQSGNAWLAAGDAAKARKAFDAALATVLLTPELRGEVHLDRARAGVALGDLAGARVDLDKGLELVPADPFGWYLSSALAQRRTICARAEGDIAKAVSLAPDDADLLLQAGNLAGLSGEVEAAHGSLRRAPSRPRPIRPPGKAAAAALAANAEDAEPPRLNPDRSRSSSRRAPSGRASRCPTPPLLAVARADREIALGRLADPADRGAAESSANCSAPWRASRVAWAIIAGLTLVQFGEAVDHPRPFLDRDAVADQVELAREGRTRLHHVAGAQLHAGGGR